MTMRTSHEAIHRYIYLRPRGSLKTTLITALRQERAYQRKRKPGNHEESRDTLAAMLSMKSGLTKWTTAPRPATRREPSF